MRRGTLHAGAVVALLAFAPVALGEEGAHVVTDAPRADSAPLDMPPGADVVEVTHGLVWLRLQGGKEAARATKVAAGVYFTRDAYHLANEAFKARGRERDALRLQVDALEARTCPAVQVPPCAEDAHPPPAFLTGRWPTWAVVGVGVLAASAGVVAGVCLAGGCK